MRLSEAQNLGNRLLVEHGLSDWRTVIDYRARKRLGQCRYHCKEIGLTAWYVQQADDSDIRETIIHEVAHALTPGAHHGKAWRDKCIELGIEPSRTRSISCSPPLRYVGKCRMCGAVWVRYRQPNRALQCSKCRVVVSWSIEKGNGKLVPSGDATMSDSPRKLRDWLEREDDPSIRKRIRARLRRMGYMGGVNCMGDE